MDDDENFFGYDGRNGYPENADTEMDTDELFVYTCQGLNV